MSSTSNSRHLSLEWTLDNILSSTYFPTIFKLQSTQLSLWLRGFSNQRYCSNEKSAQTVMDTPKNFSLLNGRQIMAMPSIAHVTRDTEPYKMSRYCCSVFGVGRSNCPAKKIPPTMNFLFLLNKKSNDEAITTRVGMVSGRIPSHTLYNWTLKYFWEIYLSDILPEALLPSAGPKTIKKEVALLTRLSLILFNSIVKMWSMQNNRKKGKH